MPLWFHIVGIGLAVAMIQYHSRDKTASRIWCIAAILLLTLSVYNIARLIQ